MSYWLRCFYYAGLLGGVLTFSAAGWTAALGGGDLVSYARSMAVAACFYLQAIACKP